jgi:TorA maturation chaperone TorD
MRDRNLAVYAISSIPSSSLCANLQACSPLARNIEHALLVSLLEEFVLSWPQLLLERAQQDW